MLSPVSIVFLERLRELAQAASPGPWRPSASAGDAIITDQRPGGRPMNEDELRYYGGELVAESMAQANRLYVSMASPAAVLPLLDALLGLPGSPLTLDQARVIRTWAVDLECSNARVAELFERTFRSGNGDPAFGDRVCAEARRLLGEAW